MFDHDILQYRQCWQNHSMYCLGPIPNECADKFFDEKSKYCVYIVMVLSYTPIMIHGIDMVNAVVDRMLDAGVRIINQDDIDHRKDLTRLRGDRKDEFSLYLKMSIHQEHEYDYVIHHKPTNQGVLTPTSREERYNIIKKMIEAGVKIIDA